ncbi:MAG: oxygen-independent coproporphyrinogen III oxidase [Bacteroidetes bacterium]|nr:MAG: oxygen-independent coproporphyrinogen III oxidase [Bacteroidota bacterium]
MKTTLLEKYNIPAPRYTSYPTVPYWQTPPKPEEWTDSVRAAFAENPEISLYIHLPFCESLCTYCGCNKRITRNHGVERPYIESVLKEWQMYLDLFPKRPLIKELHLGGGTPTFFSPESLNYLLSNLLAGARVPDDHEFSFEAHPASTTLEHLAILNIHGFRRISVGVQDFDNEILKIINRHQTYEDVEKVVRWARQTGYNSINFDLIFGLPLQTPDHIRTTMRKVNTLSPDRIAFYSYAHVPWIKPSQRAYSEADLPVGKDKRALYELGRELLENSGYREIGLDHFALPTDDLYKAMKTGTLHRNFMGYTPQFTRLSIALGASSISDSWGAFIQNEKKIEDYRARVDRGELPIANGHLLSDEDQILRHHILNIMCRFETRWDNPFYQCTALTEGLERMDELEKDGLIVRHPDRLVVTKAGRPFLRNICLALDARYWRKKPDSALFSQAV